MLMLICYGPYRIKKLCDADVRVVYNATNEINTMWEPMQRFYGSIQRVMHLQNIIVFLGEWTNYQDKRGTRPLRRIHLIRFVHNDIYTANTLNTAFELIGPGISRYVLNVIFMKLSFKAYFSGIDHTMFALMLSFFHSRR